MSTSKEEVVANDGYGQSVKGKRSRSPPPAYQSPRQDVPHSGRYGKRIRTASGYCIPTL